jgi:hypothetical protein
MRVAWLAASVTLACAFWAIPSRQAVAQSGGPCGCMQDGTGDPCDDGACGGHRRHGSRYDGRSPGFNCGCNGSYKYPVPPLYTYHWPGMYSAQLMTDYHSPWRFPPLKPYVDEPPPEVMGVRPRTLRPIQPTAAIVPASPSTRSAPMSTHVEAMLR